jgi:hypothetical protein
MVKKHIKYCIILVLLLIIVYSVLYCSDMELHMVEGFTSPFNYFKANNECLKAPNKFNINISKSLKVLDFYTLADTCDKKILFTDGVWDSDNIDLQVRNYRSNKTLYVSFDGKKFIFNRDNKVHYEIIYNSNLDRIDINIIDINTSDMVKIRGIKNNKNKNIYNFINTSNEGRVALIEYTGDDMNQYLMTILKKNFLKERILIFVAFIIRDHLLN